MLATANPTLLLRCAAPAEQRPRVGVHAKTLVTGRGLQNFYELPILVTQPHHLLHTPFTSPSFRFLLLLLYSTCLRQCGSAIEPNMPPRLQSPKFSASAASSQISSCAVTRPHAVSLPARQSRSFSQTPCPQVTLRRRKFYEWLNGPGRGLKEPIPNATNYLGAYDKYGNLVRAGPGFGKEGAAKADTPDLESQAEESTEETTSEAQEKPDDAEPEKAETEPFGKAGEEGDSTKLQPETEEDLRPFPLNKYFRSQPVLSEDLREAIYQRVKKDGATVSLASVEFGVSNERVGAVVRLKQMEKEWIAQVCRTFSLSPSLHDMMSFLKNRLVFKTPTWLQKLSHALAERRHPSMAWTRMHSKMFANTWSPG